MLDKFNNFLKEEVWIEDMDEKSVETLKKNLKFRLDEYRTSLLSNIIYNFDTNKIEFKEKKPNILEEYPNTYENNIILYY